MLKLVRRSFILLLFLLSLVSFSFIPSASAQVRDPVHVLTLKGIINPPAFNYIQRGINQAEEANVTLLKIIPPFEGETGDPIAVITGSCKSLS
jgi:membrane-bound ClpP family serine protease